MEFFSRIKAHHWMGLGVGALIVVAVLTVETRSVVGALEENEGFTGISWAMISAIFSVLSVVSFSLAGMFKEDYREHVRARAMPARILALCLAIVPASFFGSAVKRDNMTDEWLAYSTSQVAGQPSSYELDVRLANDASADPYDQREARTRIRENTPGSIKLDPADGEFWMAIFFQAILLFGADTMRIPAPMTKAEFDHLKRSAAAKKAAATRKARAVAKKKAEPKRGLKILSGGRQD